MCRGKGREGGTENERERGWEETTETEDGREGGREERRDKMTKGRQ